MKYNAAAPITRKPASIAKATGRLRVTSGIRDPWTAFSDFAFDLGVTVNSVPQTTQRVAFSARRVPQVGQSLVVVFSGLITRALYHEGRGKRLCRNLRITNNAGSKYKFLAL